jgi:hypothetical protein
MALSIVTTILDVLTFIADVTGLLGGFARLRRRWRGERE